MHSAGIVSRIVAGFHGQSYQDFVPVIPCLLNPIAEIPGIRRESEGDLGRQLGNRILCMGWRQPEMGNNYGNARPHIFPIEGTAVNAPRFSALLVDLRQRACLRLLNQL